MKKTDHGYGYVPTAERPLRGDREYAAEVSFKSGDATVSKRWMFRTSPFLYELNIDDMPIRNAPNLHVVNNRVQVPMRFLFELFGARVDWDKAAKTVTAYKTGISVRMTIDDPVAHVNGEDVHLDGTPRLVVDTTCVPLRFISEAFGFQVNYDPETRSVDIWTGLLDQSEHSAPHSQTP